MFIRNLNLGQPTHSGKLPARPTFLFRDPRAEECRKRNAGNIGHAAVADSAPWRVNQQGGILQRLPGLQNLKSQINRFFDVDLLGRYVHDLAVSPNDNGVP
jgi:hypothetical protein